MVGMSFLIGRTQQLFLVTTQALRIGKIAISLQGVSLSWIIGILQSSLSPKPRVPLVITLFTMLFIQIVSTNFNIVFRKNYKKNTFQFVSFFDRVDNLLEIDCEAETCAELITTEALVKSSLQKYVYNLPEGIPELLPLDFNQISMIKCYLHNLYRSRCLISRLELTNSEALFAEDMPLKVTLLTPSA